MTRHGMRAASLPAQLLIPFALLSLMMFMIAGLAIDLSGAWWMSEQQTDILQTSRQAVMGCGNVIKFGFATDSGTLSGARSAIELVKRSLADGSRAGGTERVYDITAYELPRSSTGKMNRLIGVEISVSGVYKTTLARTIGVETVPVSSRTDFIVNPYSSTEVYRPVETDPGWRQRVRISEGAATVISSASVSYGEVPQTLRDALEAALADLES